MFEKGSFPDHATLSKILSDQLRLQGDFYAKLQRCRRLDIVKLPELDQVYLDMLSAAEVSLPIDGRFLFDSKYIESVREASKDIQVQQQIEANLPSTSGGFRRPLDLPTRGRARTRGRGYRSRGSGSRGGGANRFKILEPQPRTGGLNFAYEVCHVVRMTTTVPSLDDVPVGGRLQHFLAGLVANHV